MRSNLFRLTPDPIRLLGFVILPSHEVTLQERVLLLSVLKKHLLIYLHNFCCQIYADMLERQQQQGKDFGGNLPENYLSKISEDQLYQLHALHQEITSPSEGSDVNGKN